MTRLARLPFNGTNDASTLEVKQEVSNPVVSTSTGKVVVKPQEAFKVAAGQKTVFVVVNPTNETNTHLNTATLGQFKTSYSNTALALTAASGGTVADKLAVLDGTQHVITMTGSSATPTIVAGVSAADAASGINNNVALQVQRTVAAVNVTTKAPSYSFAGFNPENGNKEDNFITVSELSYVVAQGEKSLYLLQKANANSTTDGAAFTTPSYSYITNNDYATSAGTYYDYSGLKITEPGRKTDGLQLQTVADNNLTSLTPTFKKTAFILPTVHKFSANSRDNSGYRKGNTPYVLVRGLLTPKKYVGAGGVVKPGTDLEDGNDLFFGETTGLFYISEQEALNPQGKGVAGQKVRKFTKRVVLYWAWLNPDGNFINSPVIRNNVYNIHITAIKNLGGNWNPLVPNEADNPNPKPNNPNEPTTPPVDPNDPLTLDKTWMSTNVTVLPWQVHSHEITLSL